VVQTNTKRHTARSDEQQHEANLMRIILAIDNSAYSKEAIKVVAARPWPRATTVRVLSAVYVSPIFIESACLASVGIEALQEETEICYEVVMEKAANSLRRSGLKVETVLRQDSLKC
jgi:hypothetical protein